MRIDNGDDETTEAVETDEATDDATDDATEAAGDATEATSATILTTEQSDAVDMLRGRINSALIGFDADSRLTILETVRAVLNQMIDDVITELVGDDDEAESDDETGNESDDDDRSDEYEPVSFCPACGEPIDYCQGHGEIGDPAGWAVLNMHDNGDHSHCVEEADCLGLAD